MRISKTWIALAIAAASFSPLAAQSPLPSKPTSTATDNLHKLDNTSTGPGVRVSKLIGMKIQNSNKESVGQINDFVIDPSSTRVQYVAVTYGGFLGLGDKMFAVPMQAIRITNDPDNSSRVILVMDVTKEQMTGAQGFDENNWPNFSNAEFASELHRRYKVDIFSNRDSQREGKLDINIDKNGTSVNLGGSKK